MWPEFADLFRLYTDIGPVEIPIRIDIIIQLEVHLATDPLYHIVTAGMSAQNKLA